MADVVNICNMALIHAKTSITINDINEGSNEADYCKAVFETARDEVLRDFDWNFAQAYQFLSPSTTKAATGWAHRYAYPNSCLKARRIATANRNDTPPPFQIVSANDGQSKEILCDIAQAELIFTRRITNVEMFDVKAAEALSLKIAHYISSPLGLSKSDKADLRNAYYTVLNEAAVADSAESGKEEPTPADWIAARG